MKSFIMERLILINFSSQSTDLRLGDFTSLEFIQLTLMVFLKHLMIKKFMLADYLETLIGQLSSALHRPQF